MVLPRKDRYSHGVAVLIVLSIVGVLGTHFAYVIFDRSIYVDLDTLQRMAGNARRMAAFYKIPSGDEFSATQRIKQTTPKMKPQSTVGPTEEELLSSAQFSDTPLNKSDILDRLQKRFGGNGSMCTNLLHDGAWRIPREEVSSYSFRGNQSMVWEPGASVGCDWHVYNWTEMVDCFQQAEVATRSVFQPDRSLIKIIGDSRGRQYFTVLHAMMTGSDQVHDSAQGQKDNQLDIFGYKLDQKWLTKVKSKLLKPQIDADGANWLYVIPSMVLHPLWLSGSELLPDVYERLKDGTEQTARMEEIFRTWENEVLPYLVDRANSTNEIFIILSAELIKPELYKLDAHRNQLIQKYNTFLKNLIPKPGIAGKIFLMTTNLQTYRSMDGGYMMPDRIHLVKKDRTRRIPPAIKVNVNLILNVACNRILRPADATCCM